MFGSLGLPEILVILVLALLIFGPKRLPEVGRTIGKGLAEFRRATTDLKRSVNAELSLEEDERPATSRRPVQNVGRTAAEAATARELPAATPGAVEAAVETEADATEPAASEGAAPEGTAPEGTAPRTGDQPAAEDQVADIPAADAASDEAQAADAGSPTGAEPVASTTAPERPSGTAD